MNIFLDEEDFGYFLGEVFKVSISHCMIIHSYCLMNNHLHLLWQNPLVNLSEAMQLILTRYADYFKRKYNHRGKVFEKRFTLILIDTEIYLMQLVKIKEFISKFTSDIKLQSSLLILALREKTNMSYKDISKEFFF
jgi:hypothetical protein